MLNSEQALDEARRQKEALAQIGSWRRTLFVLAALLFAAAVFGLKLGGGFFPLGVIAAVATGACVILTCVVDLSIRNGRRNVERILETLQ